jgi:hypothetical protein
MLDLYPGGYPDNTYAVVGDRIDRASHMKAVAVRCDHVGGIRIATVAIEGRPWAGDHVVSGHSLADQVGMRRLPRVDDGHYQRGVTPGDGPSSARPDAVLAAQAPQAAVHIIGIIRAQDCFSSLSGSESASMRTCRIRDRDSQVGLCPSDSRVGADDSRDLACGRLIHDMAEHDRTHASPDVLAD